MLAYNLIIKAGYPAFIINNLLSLLVIALIHLKNHNPFKILLSKRINSEDFYFVLIRFFGLYWSQLRLLLFLI